MLGLLPLHTSDYHNVGSTVTHTADYHSVGSTVTPYCRLSQCWVYCHPILQIITMLGLIATPYCILSQCWFYCHPIITILCLFSPHIADYHSPVSIAAKSIKITDFRLSNSDCHISSTSSSNLWRSCNACQSMFGPLEHQNFRYISVQTHLTWNTAFEFWIHSGFTLCSTHYGINLQHSSQWSPYFRTTDSGTLRQFGVPSTGICRNSGSLESETTSNSCSCDERSSSEKSV